MTVGRSVRWGILGTANIARNLFLPSLREAGGEPAAVGAFTAALDAVFDRFQQDGLVTLHYHTTVHLARRRS